MSDCDNCLTPTEDVDESNGRGKYQHDLQSIMTAFKKYPVPEEMRAMRNVAYTSAQMFAASWLANTQTLSAQSKEISWLKNKFIELEKVQQSAENLKKFESHSKYEFGNNSNLKLQESVKLLLEQQNSLSLRLTSIEKRIIQSKIADENEKEGKNPDSKNVRDNRTLLENMQNVLQIHSKKISELIKRYKKDHAQINQIQKKITDLSTVQIEMESEKSQIMKTMNAKISELSANENRDLSETLSEIKQNMSLMKIEYDEQLQSLKCDFSGHESEHEGIINEIIAQMDNMKNYVQNIANKSSMKDDTLGDTMSKSEVLEMIQNGFTIEDEEKKLLMDEMKLEIKEEMQKNMQQEIQQIVQQKTAKIESAFKIVFNEMQKMRAQQKMNSDKKVKNRSILGKKRPSNIMMNTPPVIASVDLEKNVHRMPIDSYHHSAAHENISQPSYSSSKNKIKRKYSGRHRKNRIRSSSFEHHSPLSKICNIQQRSTPALQARF